MVLSCLQNIHGVHEIALKISLSHLDALEFVHGASLLLSLLASEFKRLVLGFDSSDLTLDLLLPAITLAL
jgi:hypothetical protein